MTARGRPPKPTEVKRRAGNPGKRPLPAESNVVALAPARGVPEPPVTLGADGMRLWERAWHEAIVWLSPQTDMDQVVEACRLVDDLEIARVRYRATREPSDGRIVTQLSKSMTEALSALGFNPTARARLGVAEVKRQSALEALLERRAARD